MTREELKAHCEKQIEMCEFWAISKGEKPSGKIYEEHKLILELLEQEPFINKPCISEEVCREDKIQVLDKIKDEIENIEIEGYIKDVECFNAGINTALNIIDKYKQGA